MMVGNLADSVEAAAYNNASWHQIVCNSHGIPYVLSSQLWSSSHKTPFFYANAVTLSKEGVTHQLERIENLCNQDIEDFGVKDSFDLLDLSSLGLQSLFSANWLYRPVIDPVLEQTSTSTRRVLVESASELERWESAWRVSQHVTDESLPRFFLPSLLEVPGVVFIAGYERDEIVAGGIGNRTGSVVGLSNVFSLHDPESIVAGLADSLSTLFPGFPLVGYEQADAIPAYISSGFGEIGSLRVWIK